MVQRCPSAVPITATSARGTGYLLTSRPRHAGRNSRQSISGAFIFVIFRINDSPLCCRPMEPIRPVADACLRPISLGNRHRSLRERQLVDGRLLREGHTLCEERLLRASARTADERDRKSTRL